MILIPIGGTGSRFKEAGFSKPKPLINAMGKEIICWLIDNLDHSLMDTILIPYNIELFQYNFENWLENKYPELSFIFLKLTNNTGGAVETIKYGLDYLTTLNYDDEPVLCIDSDNFYLENVILLWNRENCVITFEDLSKNPIYSYVSSSNNIVQEIKEKYKISNNACCGCYGFSSWNQLRKYCKKVIENKIKEKGEYYTSKLIQEMINDGNIFINKSIEKSNYICLGTPFQVRIFCNNYPIHSALTSKKKIKNSRFCFDLDGTLVSFPNKKGDYSTVEPIEKNIIYLKYLKRMGHTIIIQTARNMKTYNGNIGKINANTSKVIFKTLEKFKIPYDEIYFGKPYADFYIDDLAVNANSNLSKELGFYDTKIETRNFNNLESNSINTYTKKGFNILGEIYYYQNIPSQVKDLFPIMISFDDNSYTMEKIIGIPISKLYLDEELSVEQLSHVLNSLNRLHSINNINDNINDNINIYENYVNKIKQRYESYDYSKFINSDKLYNELIDYFTNYESTKSGKKGIIHGDPVFTNIIINNHEKIKFIDMRGKIGETLSIVGDIFYDYAKIYQSIIGYDEILFNKYISINYKKKIIKWFEDKIINKFGKNQLEAIKQITKSLLFTLLPLHNNKKCNKYFNLIKNI